MAVFTRKELLVGDWTPRKIRTQLNSGAWRQLIPGRFVKADVWNAATPDEQHAMLAMAKGLGRKFVIWRDSAACLHGFRVLTTPTRIASRHSTEFRSEDLTKAYGVSVTRPAVTAIDVARFLGIEAGLVVADSAVAKRRTNKDELCRIAQRLERCQGKQAALIVAGEADGRAESAFESVSRYRLVAAGVPRPTPQVRLLGYRVDFLWQKYKVIGEADGLKKYGANEAAVRASLREERRRQQRPEDLGYVFVRWTWDEIWFTPEVVVARVLRRLAERQHLV
jgi:very-short-patch-repair endonuclease